MIRSRPPATERGSHSPATAFPEANRISRIASEALKYYPAPTSNGVGPAHIQNYPFPSRWVANMNQWTGRLDYQVNSSRNSVFFRYGQNPFEEFRGLVFVTDLNQDNPAEPTGNAPLIRNGRNWTANWTSTISPRLTFNLRAGLNRWEDVETHATEAHKKPA